MNLPMKIPLRSSFCQDVDAWEQLLPLHRLPPLTLGCHGSDLFAQGGSETVDGPAKSHQPPKGWLVGGLEHVLFSYYYWE